MAIGDFVKQGPAMKVRAYIVTVDPTTRRVEARIKDGAVVQVAVWELPLLFRWPIVGEWWTLIMESGYWMLDKPIEVRANATLEVEALEEGDVRINAPSGRVTIMADTGTRAFAYKHVETVGDGIKTVFPIVHNLNTYDIMGQVRSTTPPRAVLIEDDAGYAAALTNPNTLTLTFPTAPATLTYTVTVIG